MLNIRQLLETTHATLAAAEVRHALIGGLALGAHGVQRFTNDVDWLVHGDDRGPAKQTLLSSGFAIVTETAEVAHFTGLGSVDLHFANRQNSQQMLEKAKPTLGLSVPCLGAEAIIGLKVQAYCNAPKRELRDKADIQALMEANVYLDWQEIKRYADLFGEWAVIEDIRKRAQG